MKRLITNVSDVAGFVNEVYTQEVEKLAFRAPMSRDGATVDKYGLWYGDELLETTCKDGFECHTRDDFSSLIEATMLALGASSFEVDLRWKARKGHFATIQPSAEFNRSIGTDRDKVTYRGYIDGRYGRPLTSGVGAFRLLCANGMVVPMKDNCHITKIRHTVALRSRIDELVTQLSSTVESFESVVAKMRSYSEQQVLISDFISALYPAPSADASGKSKTQYENMRNKILSRLHREAKQVGDPVSGTGLDATSNLWLLVNSVTGYVQHDKSRHGVVAVDQRELLALDDVDTIAAWALADTLAG